MFRQASFWKSPSPHFLKNLAQLLNWWIPKANFSFFSSLWQVQTHRKVTISTTIHISLNKSNLKLETFQSSIKILNIIECRESHNRNQFQFYNSIRLQSWKKNCLKFSSFHFLMKKKLREKPNQTATFPEQHTE